MEALFFPTARLQHYVDGEGPDSTYLGCCKSDERPTEVECAAENWQHLVWLQATRGARPTFTWTQLCSYLAEKILWPTPDAFIAGHEIVFSDDHTRRYTHMLSLGGESDGPTCLFIYATSPQHAQVVCQFLIHLFLASGLLEAHLEGTYKYAGAEDDMLSYFLAQRLETLGFIYLGGFRLTADHLGALATLSDVEAGIDIELYDFRIADGAEDTFIECLQRHRGPTVLSWCRHVQPEVLRQALHGNTSVKKLELGDTTAYGEQGRLEILQGIAASGIEYLQFNYTSIADEDFSSLCEALAAHSTLQTLKLPLDGWDEEELPSDQNVRRMRYVEEMLKSNTVLHTIEYTPRQLVPAIYDESIQPRLTMNRYRPLFKAVTQSPYSVHLLALALTAVRHDPNLVQLLLSVSKEVVMYSTNAAIDAEESNCSQR